jgi:hypothetical protein
MGTSPAAAAAAPPRVIGAGTAPDSLIVTTPPSSTPASVARCSALRVSHRMLARLIQKAVGIAEAEADAANLVAAGHYDRVQRLPQAIKVPHGYGDRVIDLIPFRVGVWSFE